ncbi:MAG: protein kinase, partial [Candidatus Aminicenantes bacterium]|nr:protein kinase [Candidatus Aminicenantes bacterium]
MGNHYSKPADKGKSCMRCPECSLDNPTDSKFCKECGTSLSIREDAGISHTKTYETSQEELSTGSIFAGRYQIVEELGRGGMGRIYKAVDNEVGEKIALKLIKPEISADKDTIERFRNELKFARKVRHKNVCQMFDLNRERDTYFITMEYVAGEDLKNMIRMTKRLGVSTALDIAFQICEGLAEAHKQDVIHRDLKPNNIMLDREGNVRIMDFGIARSLKGKGRTGVGVIFGTPEYMSPEQVEAKEVDQRSDIYSLGVILYEMVTGRLPFEADTPFAVGVKHKSEIPQAPRELNSNIPDDLNLLILKCLEKEKDSRYQSAGELSSELKRITQGLPLSEKQALPKKPLTSREFTVSLSPKKIWVPALIFIGIMIAGFVIWQLLFHEPVIPFEERRSVAVIGFDNHTGESRFEYLSQAVPSILISKLEQSQQLRVITWERMQDILEQMGHMDVTTIDRELGFELCQKEGIEAIVIGSVIKTGNMFATDIKVLDVSTKEIL